MADIRRPATASSAPAHTADFPSGLDAYAASTLEALETAGRRRGTRCLDSRQQPEQTLDGRRITAFCSNDYLGLAADPRLARAATDALHRYGTGAGAAHLINGHHRLHEELEAELARFTGRDAALLFSTGYMANLGMLQTLGGRGATVFADRWNHASLIDAASACGARSLRYRHADTGHLEERLRAAARRPGERWLIVTDGVFSMDGDLAPLTELAALAAQHDAWLIVDDAHGFGVLGASGAGSVEHAGLDSGHVPVLMATLGKAIGTAGAFVAGSRPLIELLRNRARSYVYTTAQPPAIAAATLASLAIVRAEPQRRARLHQLVERLRAALHARDLALLDSPTPIQPVRTRDGSEAAALAAARQLEDRGFLVPAIRPPTVPAGSARLRVSVSAIHSNAQLDSLIAALTEVLPDTHGVAPGCDPA